jgi:O-antigen/teichoic acid export membrane protein
VTLLFSMAGTVVLARVLTPAETGAFAFSVAMFALVQSLLQFGMGHYILRAEKLTSALSSAATTLAILQGVLASCLMAAVAPVAGYISGDPRIVWLSLLVAVVPIFSGPEAICLALWAREARFGRVAALGASKALVQSSVSIVAAWAGWGAFALAAGFVAAAIVSSGWSAYQIFVRDRIRLGLDRNEWLLLKNYSASSMLLTITTTLNLRLPELFIGRMFTIAALGQFSRAGSTIDMLSKSASYPTARVFMPRMMNAMNAGEPIDKSVGEMRDVFLFVMWPALAGLLVLAEPLTLFLYGDQWQMAGKVLTLLCVGCAFDVARSGAMELLLFRDRLRLNNKIEAIRLIVNIGLLALAFPFGFMAVIWSQVAAAAFSFLLYGWTLHRLEGFPLLRYMRNYAVHGALAFVAVFPALALMIAKGWPQHLPFGQILLVVVAGVVAWIVALLAIGHPAAKIATRALRLRLA